MTNAPGVPRNDQWISAKAGQDWGGFTFFSSDAETCDSSGQSIAPPRPLRDGEADLLIAGHPGYREFNAVEDLGRFVEGRAVIRIPQFVPKEAQFLGGYAVMGDDSRIFVVGLSYRLGESHAEINDADLWINYDLYTPRPLPIPSFERRPGLGTAIEAPQLTKAHGRDAVHREARNPPGLHRSLAIRSSLNWFEEDGSFWAVQAHGLPRGIVQKVADSLQDY
jgi:hypothetical protein